MNNAPRALFDWEIQSVSQSTKADQAGIDRIEALKAETAAGEAAEKNPLSWIRFIGDIQRLKVEPGDIYVLKCDQPVSVETAERLREVFIETVGDVKVLVLSEGMTLSVISDSTLTGGGDVAEPRPAEACGEGTCGSGRESRGEFNNRARGPYEP